MKNLMLTIALIFASIAGRSQTKNFIDQPYLEVNGNADTLIIPDEIYISIMTAESDTKNKISVEEQEIKMVNVLKSLGIDTEKDLATNDISSNFRYHILKNKDILKSKQYVLKVKDAVTATKVFIRLEDIEISNTSIQRVDHSDKENIRNLVRSKAILNARSQANAMVKPLNQTVGVAIHIADNENVNYNNGLLQGSLIEVKARGYNFQEKIGEAEIPDIEFNKIRIAASINVKFILN